MSEITLLDGSIGQELVKRTKDRATPLWSTKVMIDHPELVADVHRDYFDCGATVATANTYAVHRDRLTAYDLEPQFEHLLRTAISQARTARNAKGSGRVAAALGPLGASYRPDICPPPDQARLAYAEQVRLLDQDADLFLIETASSVAQAEGALMGCAETDKPVWLAASVMDDDGTRLRSGEPLSHLAPLVEKYAPDAVLINCSPPEVIGAGLDILKKFGCPFGAYANGFTRISEGFLQDKPTVDALEQRQDLDPDTYANFALGWVSQGASIVGGCCEVGPDHIRVLADQLRAQGHTIV